jgi:hypothetical protein
MNITQFSVDANFDSNNETISKHPIQQTTKKNPTNKISLIKKAYMNI